MNTDTHPTPAHVRSCIMDEIFAYNEKKPAVEIPWAAIAAVNAGIRKACQEHDEAKAGQNMRVAS